MKILFCHIPKNAGTSITSHLKAQLPERATYLVPSTEHDLAEFIANRHDIVSAHSFIAGHIPLSLIEDTLNEFDLVFAVTRPPLERLFAVWRFLRLHRLIPVEMSIQEYFNEYKQAPTKNEQCSYIGRINTFESVNEMLNEHKNVRLLTSLNLKSLHDIVAPFGLNAEALPYLNLSGSSSAWVGVSPEFFVEIADWLADDFLLSNWVRLTTPSEHNSASEVDMESAENIVRCLYAVALKRSPAPAELGYWVSQVSKPAGIPHVIRSFFDSEEHKAAHGVRSGHPPGHYYSPVVDPSTLNRTEIEGRRQSTVDLPGIDLRWDAQDRVWEEICGCPPIPEVRYTPNNGTFGGGDAVVLSGILRNYRPKRFIEIGSGYSSARLLDTLDHLEISTDVTFIEPYPETLNYLLIEKDAHRTVIPTPVQNVDPAIFSSLEQGDILFIDSTHVLKTGSDVHFELFDVLPRLRSGVIVHFHDIFWPFEYPAEWIFDARFSWNELYAVRLLLLCGGYSIEFFNDAFAKLRPNVVAVAPAHVSEAVTSNPGGGLWLSKD